jgi:hypothetical protein
MKKSLWLAFALVWVLAACGSGSGEVPSGPSATAVKTATVAPATPAPTSTSRPTPTYPPSDVSFSIDCSALPAARLPDCDDYIARTRDLEYPILREVTGVALSACYKDMHYVIVPGSPAQGAGGFSAGATIKYDVKYSLDLTPRADVHELLHSISSCGHAMDDHVFHALILNYVYDRQGVRSAGYFTSQKNLEENVAFLTKGLDTAKGTDLVDKCRGLLQRKVGLAYFQVKEPAQILNVYRSTIAPKNAHAPNALMKSIWGSNAPKVEAIVETLDKELGYSPDVPACGL